MKNILLFLIFPFIFSCSKGSNESLLDENELLEFGVLNSFGDTLNFTLKSDTLLFEVPYSFNSNEKLNWFALASKKSFINPNPQKEKLDVLQHSQLIITSESGKENILKLSFKKALAIKHTLVSFHILNETNKKIKTISGKDYLKIINLDSITSDSNNDGGLGSGSLLPSHLSGSHLKFYIIDTLALSTNEKVKSSLLILKSDKVVYSKPQYELFKNGETNKYLVYSEDGKLSSEYIFIFYSIQ